MWGFRWAAKKDPEVYISGSALGTSRMVLRSVYCLCVERAEESLLCLMARIHGKLYL